MEIRLSIGRRVRDRQIEREIGETERGIGRGIRALLVENQENIYTMTKYFEEYTITARKIATSFT